MDRVVNALIAAERAAIPLLFERAAAIDLAGRDVLRRADERQSQGLETLWFQQWPGRD